MKGHIIKEKMNLFADGLLTGEDAAIVSGHIAECPECAKLYNDILVGKNIARAYKAEPVSEELDGKVREAVRLEKERLEKGRRLDEIMAGIFSRMGDMIWQGPALKKGMVMAVSFLFVLGVTATTLQYSEGLKPFVIASQGDVKVYIPGENRWAYAEEGMRIKNDYRISTGRGSQIEIMAKRLYNIKIKADSDVTFQKIARLNNRDNGLYIQQGRALFSTRSKFKGSRLEALSPVARAEVIGTQFSVDVDPLSGGGTWISVFRGKVSAEGLNPPSSKQAVNKVIVGSGQRVYVGPGNIPDTPRPLQKRELEDAYEIYRMADTSAVVLMISAGPGRVEELLAPCMLYIHDVKPRRFSREFDKAISDITDAINKNDINLHASALKRLKALCDSHRYQEDKDKLYLFLGAYAYFIKDYRQALEAFDLCLKSNPNSPLASLALCAEAVAYERGLKDKMQASAIYNRIIQSYPDTPESEYSKTALKKE